MFKWLLMSEYAAALRLPIKKPNSEVRLWGRDVILADKLKLRATHNRCPLLNDWQAVLCRLLNNPEWSNTLIRHVPTFCSHLITSVVISDSMASGLFQAQCPFYCATPPKSSPSVCLCILTCSRPVISSSLSSLPSLSAALPPPSIR